MLGDRLDTDLAGARELGMGTILVLSGTGPPPGARRRRRSGPTWSAGISSRAYRGGDVSGRSSKENDAPYPFPGRRFPPPGGKIFLSGFFLDRGGGNGDPGGVIGRSGAGGGLGGWPGGGPLLSEIPSLPLGVGPGGETFGGVWGSRGGCVCLLSDWAGGSSGVVVASWWIWCVRQGGGGSVG